MLQVISTTGSKPPVPIITVANDRLSQSPYNPSRPDQWYKQQPRLSSILSGWSFMLNNSRPIKKREMQWCPTHWQDISKPNKHIVQITPVLCAGVWSSSGRENIGKLLTFHNTGPLTFSSDFFFKQIKSSTCVHPPNSWPCLLKELTENPPPPNPHGLSFDPWCRIYSGFAPPMISYK